MSKYISQLDTLRFGFKVAKVNEFLDTPMRVVCALRQQGVSLVISRVATGDIDLINQMEDVGFRLKDVQLTYGFDCCNPLPPLVFNESCDYRALRPEDIVGIARIAADAFRNYGHYSKTEQTRTVNSSVIYEDWARRTCTTSDIADYIVVAEMNAAVAGFLSLKIGVEGHTKFAAGVIGAVSKEYRHVGIFRGINIAGLHWAREQGIARVEHNVLVNNASVIKTYTSLGFNVIRSETTFHCWLGQCR